MLSDYVARVLIHPHPRCKLLIPPASLFLLMCNKQRICSLFFLHKSSCVRWAAIVPEIVVVVLLSIRLSGLWIISQFLQKQKAQQCLKAPAPLHPHPQFKHQAGSSVLHFFFFKKGKLGKATWKSKQPPKRKNKKDKKESDPIHRYTQMCTCMCKHSSPPLQESCFFYYYY